ncbi:MAG: methylenetetrahydrofolate reductase C-terminal domain-containing protein [Planctomycetaceae bacterium]|nr:methylenetetrahydrofolate reductase C-terminal domain-containing protein [Planctomycetaceae bacterium]
MSTTMKRPLRETLTQPNESFPLGAEIVTSRGIPTSGKDAALETASVLLADERFSYVSITDNPGGNPMLPPDYLAAKLADYAPNVVIHLSCKDFNKAGLESQLWRYAAEGFENILALSGDLPTDGYPVRSTGVFDLDSVGLLAMITAMNSGLPVKNRKQQVVNLPATDFFTGCAVNPFKQNENELVPQYYKLLRKIKAGAKWVLPQLGYDMRKFAEVKTFLEKFNSNVPLIGNVYVLTKTAAEMFNAGVLAGCTVSDGLLADIKKYCAGEDKGKQFFKELAAKQIAVFRGLGFTAAHIGGIAKPESFFEIADLSKQFADDWKTFYNEIQYSDVGTFFYYDAEGRENTVLSQRKRTKNVNLFYRFSRLVHAVAFNRNRALYPVLKSLYRFLKRDKLVCRCVSKTLHLIESSGKNLMYGCSDCGDCGLPDTAYLCPMNSCSKNMRNGPCGGSQNGRCEAGDKNCVWTIAYDRMKYFGEWDDFKDLPPICYNAALKDTSSWANLYLDRDHSR